MPYKQEGREYVQGLTFDQHVMVTLVTFQLKKGLSRVNIELLFIFFGDG
jgi:phage terminase large subunit-like protein